ncbi:uncharacterized protein A1O5_12452 [Cladophialophora psammophila CBS 110553]|uniref:Myb-like domain-containing protein n=1 Tax=Cladophialophora psammophila CBS 110553 TaxID=1182543 RepID=W9VPK2_9EURO|nr:uncharacterized protein A1O5_12452 [Cladophialophora psammophila CBS 110553]EXJ57662.1 hypothetical protein A1O5_12452 [Cladophialophora psammophila CBS 110553]
MAPRPRLRSSSRKDTPLSPPKAASISVVIDALPDQNKSRTRSSSREATAAQQLLQDLNQVLPTVTEAEPVSEQTESLEGSISASFEATSTGSSFESLLDALDRDAIIENLIDLRNNSIELFSILGADETRLADICSKLLQIDPSLHRRFLSRKKRFLTTKEAYGGGPDFIFPGLIVRKILGDAELREINNGLWRPDGVLYLANLALQLVRVFSPSLDERHSYLDFMFNNFPEPFYDLASFPFLPATVKDTFDIHTEILTQFYIREVAIKHHDEKFDPDELLGAVFCDESNQIKGSSDKATHSKAMARMSSIKSHFNTEKRPWINIEALEQQFPWSNFVVQVVKWSVARKNELEEMIRSRGGMDKLIDLLYAEDFQDDAALSDGFSQGSELATPSTEAQEPAPVDIKAEELEDANIRPTQLTQRAAAGGLSRKAMKANINRLKALRAEHSVRASGAKINHVDCGPPESELEISQSLSPVIEETQETAVGEDDDQAQRLAQARASNEEIVPTQQTNLVLETVRRQIEQSDKENKKRTAKKASLLDRQNGAERVEWGEPADDEDTPSPPRRLPKRPRPRRAEDNDDHDEFETDSRARKRRRASHETSQQPLGSTRPRLPSIEEDATAINDELAHPSDRSRTVEFASRGQPSRRARAAPSKSPERSRRTLPVSLSQPARSGTQGSPSSRAPLRPIPAAERHPPPSTAPTRTQPESLRSSRAPSLEPPRSQIADVNREAKARVRMTRDLLPTRGGVQIRRPYTEQETTRLMEMIELYGTRWARILEEDSVHEDGPLLQGRTQVQLKDKARNIKLDFLKAGRRLPPGFETVSVGQSKIQELRERGIDYVEGEDAARFTGREPTADDGYDIQGEADDDGSED